MARKRTLNSYTLFGNSILHPLNLILIFNCIIFFIQLNADYKMVYLFALTPELFFTGSYWQIFTYGFLHSTSFFLHLFMNMYGMYMLGTYLEPILGKTKLVLLYFVSQLGGGITILGYSFLAKYFAGPEFYMQTLLSPTLGASGAVFGLLVVFGILFPEREFYFFFIVRVKAKNIVWLSLFIGYLFEIFGSSNVSNTGHLGGALFGYIFFLFFIKNTLGDNILKSLSDTISNIERKAYEIQNKNQVAENTESQKNLKLLNEISKLSSFIEKENYLIPLQVENANICPPPTYNPEDSYCLNCEWFANCNLRKLKSESK